MQIDMEIIMATFAVMIAGAAYLVFRKVKGVDANATMSSSSASGVGGLDTLYDDEIIAVRKRDVPYTAEPSEQEDSAPRSALVLHVMTEQHHVFQGYDLLQALLSQGFKYGEMKVFHRFQEKNGKGARLFSVASAVEPGTFDIHHMGGSSFTGLTLFMQVLGNTAVDCERFTLMCATANELKKELGGRLLNEAREELSEGMLVHYRKTTIASLNKRAVA